jgi:hypothetical protein
MSSHPAYQRQARRLRPPVRWLTVLAACVITVLVVTVVLRSLAPEGSATSRPGSSPLPDWAGSETACQTGGQGRVEVHSAAELSGALAAARPGQVVHLADGVYRGTFRIARSGRPDARIVLCGSRRAVLSGLSPGNGYALHLRGASHWTLSGFTVTNAQKGIMLDRSSFNLLHGLAVHGIGQEGIHFRAASTDNLLEQSEVRNTGLVSARTGEGVYVGSALSNWCEHSGCQPDRSDRNQIVGNRIGPATRAESVDIKEGTTGGLVRGNAFVGTDMTGADSWVDVKGNRWTVAANRGTDAPRDGFQVHVIRPGWGRGNVFAGNVADLGDGEYGFRVDKDAVGTVVGCDNVVSGASRGRSNVGCG